MSTARAPFARGRKPVDRPEAPTILPPPRSPVPRIIQGIALAGLVAVVMAMGPAEALLLGLGGGSGGGKEPPAAGTAGSDESSDSITVPLTIPLGDDLGGQVAGLVEGVVDGPVTDGIFDPFVGPIEGPTPDKDPAKPEPVKAPPSAAPKPKAPAPEEDAGSVKKPDAGRAPDVEDDDEAPRTRESKPAPAPNDNKARKLADRQAAIEHHLFALVNEERVRAGLSPLSFDKSLVALARLHSERMRDAERLFHARNISASAPSRWRHLGENVGVGSSVDALHGRFMLSRTHRVNVLGQFDRIGVGVAFSPGRIWVTQRFMRTGAR